MYAVNNIFLKHGLYENHLGLLLRNANSKDTLKIYLKISISGGGFRILFLK